MTYTTEQINSMSLKELAAATGIASLAKVSKAKAVARASAVLIKAGKPAGKAKVAKPSKKQAEAKPSKTGALLDALHNHRRTLDELVEMTGFDARNLGVTISIQRRKGVKIEYDRDTKTYSMH